MSDWFGLVARVVTGGVWIVAGTLKLPDPAGSVRAVRAYELLPEAVVPTVGYLLPALEVAVGVLQIDCGCFGGGGFEAGADEDYPWEIARDVGLLLLSLWLVVRPASRWSLDGALFGSRVEENA